ncbi:GNAT family N-acetyltransferase [Bifidobacterium sp. ESL0763]|uniref:GNAT family N-acetyltransferase n=1 Tax=Bifidobacterium sp. ESL0763 TaxID=2983227 RepID=UPI0023F662B0|nr:GNAT family N-acetyltransferase [Bifidobacterium sp. ESL0763]MDF7663294.1 GNAT family N-acetyltransferase [Bifidobacterium sp. ESL0763]
MSANSAKPAAGPDARQLPNRISIPEIRGEMVHLRPATIQDLPKLDRLQVYANASGDMGKDEASERALVHAWVQRSEAWQHGVAPGDSGVGDPESRRTMAWAILTDADHDIDGKIDAGETDNVIGMIFLIDLDGWSRSARIQVMLGRDYRGRGYSRDAMPRVMTYAFASEPAGLGMHRIWVAVPEKSARTLSVYQSLGFIKSGTSRDSLWDPALGKYQDLIVLDTLVDEYDPIRSLDAFGMHVIEGNPGVKEAMAAREHSIEIQQRAKVKADQLAAEIAKSATADASGNAAGSAAGDTSARSEAAKGNGEMHSFARSSEQAGEASPQSGKKAKAKGKVASKETASATEPGKPSANKDGRKRTTPVVVGKDENENGADWPFSATQTKTSKKAWWRNLGHGNHGGRTQKDDRRSNDQQGGRR